MTETRKNLEAARVASHETQLVFHKLYQADTSNALMWEMFQAQVEKTRKLTLAITAEIVKSWESV